MQRPNQQGFTLIELIMVIVILGILAATALPKFINMSGDARAAALKGAHGAINSAINIVHAQALIEGKTAASGESITMEGSTVNLVYGYPAATAAGIEAAVKLTGDVSFTTAGTTVTAGAATAASCKITYAAATSASSPATATLVVSDCS